MKSAWAVLALVLLAVPVAAQEAGDSDPAGDVRADAGGDVLDEPGIDLVEARARIDGDRLVLGLRVNGTPAFSGEATGREAAYVWVLAFDPPAGTRPFHQQDAVVSCTGPEGGQPTCRSTGAVGDVQDAGVLEDTFTVVVPLDARPGTMAVGAAANLQQDGTVVAQDFTPGADPFGPRPDAPPTTKADETPLSLAWVLVALGLAARAVTRPSA